MNEEKAAQAEMESFQLPLRQPDNSYRYMWCANRSLRTPYFMSVTLSLSFPPGTGNPHYSTL